MTLHDDLAKMRQAGKFEPWVYYLRFPRYKALRPDTRIDFTHPITALVGPNGVNKTSILYALYGVPKGNSTGTFWFSTATDTIRVGANKVTGRPAHIHGRRDDAAAGDVVESLKTRIHTDKRQDYWEPSRPIKEYGMAMKDASLPGNPKQPATRWGPIEKPVMYLQLSGRISAFDRYFHLGGVASDRERRKARIKIRAGKLQHAMSDGLEQLRYYGIDRILHHEVLSPDDIESVSQILQRSYEEIRWIEHRFFGPVGVTVMLKAKGLESPYTEAFAGSGEFAVCQMVRDIRRAEKHTLLLIDEPEMFLHPGAQARFMDFLVREAKQNLHQIVITTHAPAIIRELPANAIKVLALDDTGVVSLVAQAATAETAFHYIGEPIANVVSVYVEDLLARHLVLKAVGDEKADLAKLNISVLPGGASALWNHARSFSAAARTDIRLLMDGDMRCEDWPPVPTQIGDTDLDDCVKRVAKQALAFSVDGGDDGGHVAQKRTQQRRFLEWVARYVDFLPGSGSPEDWILDSVQPVDRGDLTAKEYFEREARAEVDGDVDSKTILEKQRRVLRRIPSTHADLVRLRNFVLGPSK